MSVEERNMELMQTLDDAWNAQDVEVFRQRHKPDVVVRWPGKPPTHGIEDHTQESIEFWQTFPDQHLDNRPYRVFFASRDWTCSIAHFTGPIGGAPLFTELPSRVLLGNRASGNRTRFLLVPRLCRHAGYQRVPSGRRRGPESVKPQPSPS